MASGCHFVFFLCLTSGLFIAGTVTQSATDNSDEQVSGCPSGCPSGWTQFGSRCFVFYRRTRAWTDAEHFCISIGGNLASIHSADENAFLSDLVLRVSGHRHHTWIGGYDAVKEGTWLWSDGSKFSYFRWYVREPNNLGGKEHCIEMNFGGLYWNDLPCTHGRSFVCGKDL
ncbi:galactose-specific lectin nattectin-like [Scomber japonicus]|uniref:galactose-specific lectin nattectin-like n=1 Tax=Scomber japonicus TaxID=13676 RepID=UPI002304FC91|nr:galactose-specific lectin nattectin-like [Scomber japonicus]